MKAADRVQETTNAAGTGSILLQGAVTGYRTFASVPEYTNGTTVPYCITDGTEWETGQGTLASGSPWTLARTTVDASSNGGEKISVTAGMRVYVDVTAATERKISEYEILWSNAGDVAVKTGTLGRIVKMAGVVSAGSCRFGTAGTNGNTTLVVKNGSNTVGTVTIASGSATGTLTLSSTTLAAGDVLTVNCTEVASTPPINATITLLVSRL